MLIAVFITEMVILHKYVYLFIYLIISLFKDVCFLRPYEDKRNNEELGCFYLWRSTEQD